MDINKKDMKNDIEKLKKAIVNFQSNPDEYKTPKYINNDGDKIAVIYESHLVVTGVIVESPKPFLVGFSNTWIIGMEVELIQK